MKKRYAGSAALALVLFVASAAAQNVAINADGSLPSNTAILDIKSDNKGILIPGSLLKPGCRWQLQGVYWCMTSPPIRSGILTVQTGKTWQQLQPHGR